jgi:hypothetical protein
MITEANPAVVLLVSTDARASKGADWSGPTSTATIMPVIAAYASELNVMVGILLVLSVYSLQFMRSEEHVEVHDVTTVATRLQYRQCDSDYIDCGAYTQAYIYTY